MNDVGTARERVAITAEPAPVLPIPFPEFVALMALLMALTALSIDIMLPALPQIGDHFALTDPNDRQAVLIGYLVGLAAGQLVFGPLSDRFGRKRMLLAGLVLYVVGTLRVLAAGSFSLMLLARALQGFGAASPRVICVAIVRDYFSGRQMARVMSLVMMTFVVVPVFAPAVGQALLHLGDWSGIFNLLLVIGIVSFVWSAVRLPSPQKSAECAAPVSTRTAIRLTVTTRESAGYAVATGFVFGCLVAYISSAQQVFMEVYGLRASFPVMFGAIAGLLAVASFVNSRLVQRYGMRRVSHTALSGFVVVAVALAWMSVFDPPLPVFGVVLATMFFAFGLIISNFNAIAMQPLGSVAGTASSLVGFYTTSSGALFGWTIGSLFDGTVRPLAFGFAVLGVAALATVAAVEGRNRMFRGD